MYSVKYVKKNIYYDEISLIFTLDPSAESWLKAINSTRKIGYIKPSGYIRVGAKGNYYYAHRIVYCLHNRCDLSSDFDIDHIDRNPRNNSPENLRLATKQLNCLNQKIRKDNQSGIKGVKRMQTKEGHIYWVARWKENGKLKEKCFSVLALGEDRAKELASNLRLEKSNEALINSIKSVNKKGNLYE